MFLQNMLVAAQQVIILYIMVAVGFICDKTGIYTEKAARLTNDLLFYIVTPAVIIRSFLGMAYSPETAKSLLAAFGGGMLLHAAGILLALPFFRKGNEDKSAVMKYASAYGNVGYMALPLAQAVAGSEGVFFCSGILISFNLFVFTHGVWQMSGAGGKNAGFRLRWLILNPGVIPVLLGLPLFIFGVKLPELLYTPLDGIANLNTPMAMLMFGTYLAKTDLKTMFRQKEIYLVALLKLAALPLLMLGILKAIGFTGTLLVSSIISASAPSANNTVMFAAKYDGDSRLASQTVAVVSFISILTMPVMIALAKM